MTLALASLALAALFFAAAVAALYAWWERGATVFFTLMWLSLAASALRVIEVIQ